MAILTKITAFNAENKFNICFQEQILLKIGLVPLVRNTAEYCYIGTS
jgi:hypothetical protein